MPVAPRLVFSYPGQPDRHHRAGLPLTHHPVSSRHPRATTFTAGGLFRGIATFRDLETRIASLPEELARGDAFEVFVEAYLWTTAVWQVADLWLPGHVPLDVRQTLNLPADAKGIDGVFRTRAGSLVPYQVKFRIGRPKVGVAEVSTFLGLTERATDRVLISNADRFNEDVEVRDRLRLLRGTDFDALTGEDWTAITDWIEARPVTRPSWTPREDQQDALTGIGNALTTNDRATIIMPCGTGKTLVALWAAEQQHPKTVLVLVPSLALLSQTLDEWSRHTSWGDRFEYLCVCSDPSVSAEQDALQIRATDVPFHVDTDPTVVRPFLDRPSTGTVRVVFSTYHSAPVVAAGMRGLAPFDLALFDEAHKTTGWGEAVFAYALDDARLPIRKRVFFTATPRHILIGQRDKEGDFRVVSMDDAGVYGPRAYTQTFAAAVARGVICDYRVVVSVVDPEEVTAFALRHGITLVKGDPHATQWVATQIAVSKAIVATGATKVITFHSRVRQAQDFASATSRGIGQYLDGFVVHHVNGAQRVADRKDILSGFRDGQRRLVTNARCLTEGVDLPAVDMVAFSNPRKSRVDIVQAVGRAMRKPKEGTKTLGYVVVPILLAPHQANAIADACADTDWEDVIDVLAALREQDARLDEIIRAQQIAKGRGEVVNPRAFAERVQVLGPLIALEVLERHIAAVVVDRLGLTWDERYGQLDAYKKQHGDCNVPAIYPENPTLGTWLAKQRQDKRRGTLSADRMEQLDALGVTWGFWKSATWDERYAQLDAYKKQHGDCNVPAIYPDNPPLGKWLTVQRQKKERDRLSADRIERLDALGVAWDVRDATWDERYGQLVAYQHQHGHCNVSQRDPDDPRLGRWLTTQRVWKKRGTLSADRIARLDALGVVWRVQDARWEERYQELVAYLRQHRDGNVPAIYPDNPALGIWLTKQRQKKERGTLSQDRIARLDAIGVAWHAREATWDERYGQLDAYKKQHGHCNVSQRDPDDPRLGHWLNIQRVWKKRGTLSADHIARLDELGVVWELRKR